MAMGTSLVALAMVASGGSPAAPEAPIFYQAKVLTIEGTGWRSESFHRMRPVARQGTSTIWTADRALADSLAKSARSSTVSPKVQACDKSTVARTQNQFYVSHLERVSDGPVNQASRVAYVPEVSTLAEGFQATVSGRRLDQGILASVALEDTRVVRIETVGLPETIKGEPKAAENGPIGVAQRVIRTVVNGRSDIPETSVLGQVQVPEVATGRAEGEWLVPNDGVLLVSLGIRTVPDKNGMAVTQERLAIVEFDANPIKPIATESFLPATIDGCPVEVAAFPPSPFVAGEPMPIALANLPQATPPCRSLPRSIDVDGKEVELPPLPESVASADLNQIEPGSKLASPQMKIQGSMADPALARTSYIEPAPASAPAPAPVMGDFAKMPLQDFARRLIERMGEYEMDIDLSGDGRTCHISLHDAKAEGAESDPACPPEPRCDNGKEDDANVALAAMIGEFVDSLKMEAAFAHMKAGQAFEFNLPGGMKMTSTGLKAVCKPEAVEAEAEDDCPACPFRDGSEKPASASSPAPNGQAARMIVKVGDGAPATSITLGSALKNPGQTETALVPLGDKFALEIKATVVPKPATTAAKSSEAAPR